MVQLRAKLLLLLATATTLAAQSHPSWWTYASPEATALVGVDWRALRDSPFADALRSELGADGLGFPALECLDQSGQMLISSPALLAVATGSYDFATVGRQASAQGFHPIAYKNVQLWIAPRPDTLSIALMTPQVMLLGSRITLEGAIDRAADLAAQETEQARASVRRYSPLLARAAEIAHNADLWVVSTRLPDALASRFVPLQVDTRGFSGAVSVQNGLRLEAMLSASSSAQADVIAERMRDDFADAGSLARGIEVRVEGDQVGLSLSVPIEQFQLSLRNAPSTTPVRAPEVASVIVAPGVEKPKPLPTPDPPAVVVLTPREPKRPLSPDPPIVAAKVMAPPELPTQLAPVEPPTPHEPEKPRQPQVIRIFGLDSGPREIVLPDPPEGQQ